MSTIIHYLPLAKDFFIRTGNVTRQRTFAVDLTDVFGGETGLYRDQRHPNAEGYRQSPKRFATNLAPGDSFPRRANKGAAQGPEAPTPSPGPVAWPGNDLNLLCRHAVNFPLCHRLNG